MQWLPSIELLSDWFSRTFRLTAVGELSSQRSSGCEATASISEWVLLVTFLDVFFSTNLDFTLSFTPSYSYSSSSYSDSDVTNRFERFSLRGFLFYFSSSDSEKDDSNRSFSFYKFVAVSCYLTSVMRFFSDFCFATRLYRSRTWRLAAFSGSSSYSLFNYSDNMFYITPCNFFSFSWFMESVTPSLKHSINYFYKFIR